MKQSNKNGLDEFINELKNEESFNKMGPGLSMLNAGDWNGVVKWGKEFGYDFPLEDVHAFAEANPHIFNKIGDEASLAEWNLETLNETLQSS